MGVFKRRLQPQQWLTPEQMLELLGQLQLTAVAAAGAIYLAVDSAVAWALEQACVGSVAPCPQEVVGYLMVNRAPAELQAVCEELQQVLMDTQRKRRAPRRGAAGRAAAAAAAAAASARAHHQQQQQQEQAAPGCELDAQTHPTAGVADNAAAVTATAAAAGQVQDLLPSAAAPGPVVVRLTLEEAFFLQYTLGCCQVYCLSCTAAGPGPPSAQITAAASAGQLPAKKPGSSELASQLGGQVVPAAQQHLGSSSKGGPGVVSLQAAAPVTSPDPAAGVLLQLPGAGGSSCGSGGTAQADPAQQLTQLEDAALWRWCVAASGQPSAFPCLYAAYHHFRSKGWLPRSGGLYGAHYVLYRAHPAVVHSEYVVLVVQQLQAAAGGGDAGVGAAAAAAAAAAGGGSSAVLLQELQGGMMLGGALQQDRHAADSAAEVQAQLPAAAAAGSGAAGAVECKAKGPAAAEQTRVVACGGVCGTQPLTWMDMGILQRLAQQVFKKLLLVCVELPPGGACSGPEALQEMDVQEVHVRRWTPKAGGA